VTGSAPSSLRRRLEQAEAASYQGREDELERVFAMLADPSSLPAVLSVHGAPGIGKIAFAHAV